MVGHQAKGQHAHRHMLIGLVQQLDKGVKIAILMKDGAPAIPTVEDVVTVAAQGDPEGTSHADHYVVFESRRQPKKYADLLCRKGPNPLQLQRSLRLYEQALEISPERGQARFRACERAFATLCASL
jgi:hypothetical protein